MRTNFFNDGRLFQLEIEMTCGGYQAKRVATLRKVDPPTRIVGTGEDRKVLFMANPFLDFLGTWTAHHGRALFIECKSTKTHRLPFCSSGGFTEAQWNAMKTWRVAGAACALLWKFNNRVVLFTPEMMQVAAGASAKSILHENGRYVPSGMGSILWDFLTVLENELWPKVSQLDHLEQCAGKDLCISDQAPAKISLA